ncbi:MAG: metal ABC transporter solute-binding protein, Zn/Mn family [Roseiflexaceae bacterium]
MRLLTLAMVFFVLMSTSGCSSSERTAPASSRPIVVATFSILADITTRIGNGVVDVVSLVPADGDAHVYEPTPRDGVYLIDAVSIVHLGLGFEPWYEELYAASGSTAPQIIASTGIEAITFASQDTHAEDAHGAEEDTHAEDAHGHGGEFDPHVWHDVQLTMRMVQTIRDGLIMALPDQQATLTANAQAYLDELAALDAEIVAKVATLPITKRQIVTNHDTFQYFARRYQFTVLGTALGSISTESADPGAAKIAALADDIRAANVPAIFVENVANPKLIEQIASTAGVQVAPSLYTDALSSSGDATTYVDMMRYNVETIVTALSTVSP